MRTPTPPLIQCDPNGRICNYNEIARWAYLNDAVFHSTQRVCDETGESYLASIERHLATQLITRHQLIQDAATTPKQVTVLALDMPEPPDDSRAGAWIGNILLTLVIFLLALGSLWACHQGHPIPALVGFTVLGITVSHVVNPRRP